LTVLFSVGRRLPRGWFRRTAHIAGGFLSFQENIWQMIRMGLQQAKRKANASGKLNFILTFDTEHEDMHYDLQWMKVIIQGDRAAEEDEYNDCLNLYEPFGKIMKKDFKVDPDVKAAMGRQFKTKLLSMGKVEDAYKKGFGVVSDNNISNKLLEMGIMTHVEWVKDFDARKV